MAFGWSRRASSSERISGAETVERDERGVERFERAELRPAVASSVLIERALESAGTRAPLVCCCCGCDRALEQQLRTCGMEPTQGYGQSLNKKAKALRDKTRLSRLRKVADSHFVGGLF